MKAYMIVKIIMKRIRIRIKMTTAILMTIMVGNQYQNNNDSDSNYDKKEIVQHDSFYLPIRFYCGNNNDNDNRMKPS